MSDIFFLNMGVENKICQAKAILELCMEQLGTNRTEENVEYALWASAGLLQGALEKLDELRQARHDADNAHRNLDAEDALWGDDDEVDEVLAQIRAAKKQAEKKRASRKSSTSNVVKGKTK